MDVQPSSGQMMFGDACVVGDALPEPIDGETSMSTAHR